MQIQPTALMAVSISLKVGISKCKKTNCGKISFKLILILNTDHEMKGVLVFSCSETDIPFKEEKDFRSMAEYWHWFLSQYFTDSNAIVEQVFPHYQMTVKTKVCDQEAINMRGQYSHVVAQELDAMYQAR